MKELDDVIMGASQKGHLLPFDKLCVVIQNPLNGHRLTVVKSGVNCRALAASAYDVFLIALDHLSIVLFTTHCGWLRKPNKILTNWKKWLPTLLCGSLFQATLND